MEDYEPDELQSREGRDEAAVDALLAILQEGQARNDEHTARRQYLFRVATQRAVAAMPGQHPDVKRRQFLKYLANAGASTAGTDYLQPTLETLERLGKALTSTHRVDDATLQYLDGRYGEYWHDYYVTKLPGSDLVGYAQADLDAVGNLLNQSLAPSARLRLSAIAGKGATVVGALVWDMGRHADARQILGTAIDAAREARDTRMQAVAWAWTSLGWTYDAPTRTNYRNALAAAHAGRTLFSSETVLGAWLASIEAEVHANLGDPSSCMAALGDADRATLAEPRGDEWYWSRFDHAGAAGFRGICMLKLGRVKDAVVALQEAVDSLDATERHRRLTYLIDLALAMAKGGALEQACNHVREAYELAGEVRSPVKRQRLQPVHRELRQHRSARCVRLLEEEMFPDGSTTE
jgi:tetratricopeptide (TPR) repeat protein